MPQGVRAQSGAGKWSGGMRPSRAFPALAVKNLPPPDLSAGLCVGHPVSELWDADRSIAKDKAWTRPALAANAQVEAAKLICQRCPVIEACLASALAAEQGMSGFYRTGVRGGLDRYERAGELGAGEQPSMRRRAPHGTTARYRAHRADGEEACGLCREAERLASARRRQGKRDRQEAS